MANEAQAASPIPEYQPEDIQQPHLSSAIGSPAFHHIADTEYESRDQDGDEREIKEQARPSHEIDETQLKPSKSRSTSKSAPPNRTANKAHARVKKSDSKTHSEIDSIQTIDYRLYPQQPSTTFYSQVQSMSSTRLFIASLGNPPPYASTRHSAGHILLKALQSHLLFPPFRKSKTFANGLTSLGSETGRSEFVLWQSPSLMNISGVALLKAYKTFVPTAQLQATDPLPGLVVLYDEMETAPGQLRLRRGATSAKGHNGLKSVQQSLQSAGFMDKLGDRFVKIGIGIGRPTGGSRTSEDVSQYVLAPLVGKEKQMIDDKASDLLQLLEAELARMSS